MRTRRLQPRALPTRSPWTRRVRLGLTSLAAVLVSGIPACGGDPGGTAGGESPRAGTTEAGLLAFTGATIWDGTGASPVPDAVLLVRAGRVESMGPAAEVEVPAEATVHDLAGRWIVPGLINAHGHVGQALGLASGAEAHTRENIEDQLALSARYGVTTVVSLGEPGYEGVAVRDAWQAPGAAPHLDHARLFVAGVVMNPRTPEEAAPQVAERAAARVNWAKIRVDDGLGQGEAMDRPTYAATVAASHEAGLPLTAHVVTLEDARGLVDEGVDVLGHSVRDLPVDRELVERMRESGVCLHPTLTREVSTFIYAQRPDFFDDPFFLRDADPDVVAALQTPEQQARYTGRAADWYRDQLPVAAANMVTLHQGGVRIAFGTDSGPPARFQGYFEHMELEMMQEAGMSPVDVLRSATAVAAECMGLDDLGTLTPGAWADFLVVRSDPLEDVRHLRQIDQVRIAGNPVPGARFEGR
jgi:imidazolonepropionase-like amidohydrolase